MVVVLSVMDGFESELKKRLMATDLHIHVAPTPEVPGFKAGFVSSKALEEAAGAQFLKNDPRVLQQFSVLSTEAILRTGRQVTGVVLKGVDPEKWLDVAKMLVESAEPQVTGTSGSKKRMATVIVGQELAYMMGIIPGDRVTVISPTEMSGPLASVPRMKRFMVEGIYSNGLPEQELHTVFTKTSSVQSFLRKKDVATHWEISVKDFDEAPDVAAELRVLLPHFRIKDWIMLNSSLFASMRLERIAMFIILAFIVVVASFNIVTTLTMMVLEKRKEIAILKAMGARDGQVGAIFLSEGILIGTIGVLLGLVSAAILCALLGRYEFIVLPDIYYDRTLPVVFDPWIFIGVGSVALFIVLAASLYPARRAVAFHPMDGIRV